MSMQKFLFITLVIFVCIVGCTSNKEPIRQISTPTPTEEVTLVSPHQYIGVKMTVTPTIAQIHEHPDRNLIVGRWDLVNAPYKCKAVFVEGSIGNIDCGAMFVSEQRNLAWSYAYSDSENSTYVISVSDSSGALTSANVSKVTGHLISDILPTDSYMVKVQ
jgi:hypothetical protein